MPASETKNRRASIRRDCDSGIRIEDSITAERSSGRIYNFSRGGAYVELDHRLLPGIELNITVEPGDQAPPFTEFKGTVRWSHEIHGAVVLNDFGAGLRFSEPPIRRRLSSRLQVIKGGAP
jgi:hypothetical protein